MDDWTGVVYNFQAFNILIYSLPFILVRAAKDKIPQSGHHHSGNVNECFGKLSERDSHFEQYVT